MHPYEFWNHDVVREDLVHKLLFAKGKGSSHAMNAMATPEVTKVVLSMNMGNIGSSGGFGSGGSGGAKGKGAKGKAQKGATKKVAKQAAGGGSKATQTLLFALLSLELISGQKAVLTKASKNSAAYKRYKSAITGCKVTLRPGNRRLVESFLQMVVCGVLPRLRDFRGFQKGHFDGRGNFSFSIQDVFLFPQLDPIFDPNNSLALPHLDVNIHTTATSDEQAKLWLSAFQFPLAQLRTPKKKG